MNIAIDIRKIGRRQTGDESYTSNLIKNLNILDQENIYYLCTDSFEAETNAKRILGELNDNFHFHTVTPANKILWTQYSFPKFLKAKNIDLAHVQYISPLFLNKKPKLVTTIHDVSFAFHPQFIKFIDYLILNFFIPKSLKKADHIIAVSNFTKEEIQKAYQTPASKITTIYNGINHNKFHSLKNFSPSFINKIRKKFNLYNPYILNVGSMQPRKNIPLLIEAFQRYVSFYNDKNTMLILGGEKGYNYDKKIDIALTNPVFKNRIKLLGYIKDNELPLIYAMANLYISPSAYEGFNLPLAEIMKSEVPIMASNLSCHKEIVQDAGILFNPNNIDQFAKKINMILNNQSLRQKLILNGLSNIERFDWETCARETLEIYQGVSRLN